MAALLVIALTTASAQANSLARIYLCYFDRESAAISERCGQILADVAMNFTREQDGRRVRNDETSRTPLPRSAVPIPGEPGMFLLPPPKLLFRIEGHAQDPGVAEGEDILSARRASAVAAALERLGLPAPALHPVGFGASRPLVPGATPDPQNRRVEIIPRY